MFKKTPTTAADIEKSAFADLGLGYKPVLIWSGNEDPEEARRKRSPNNKSCSPILQGLSLNYLLPALPLKKINLSKDSLIRFLRQPKEAWKSKRLAKSRPFVSIWAKEIPVCL